jgi:cyclophilin family peptidyl-prolyl cis-trans isomerase
MRLYKLILIPLSFLICMLSHRAVNAENIICSQSGVSFQDLRDGIYAEFNTNKGRIVISLEYKKTPMTVANFIGLAEGTIHNASYPSGVPFYSGSIWHRVVKGHVIQGGSPAIDKAPEKEETGATGYVIPNEISDLSHNKAGMVGMANGGPHTNTCQYYITLGDRSYLDGNYTVFGEVVEGMEVVNKIVQGDTTYTIKIVRKGKDAENFLVNDAIFGKLLETQWNNVKIEEKARKEKDEKFINDNYSGLISTSSGIRYKIIQKGKGNNPVKETVMNITYTGKLINGTSFSSTADAGKPSPVNQPEVFICSLDGPLPFEGLKEILSGMKAGERRLAIVPSSIGYGQNGFYGKNIQGQKRFVISPGETLIVEVNLISFK